MIEFHLDGRSGVPAYLQLVQQVRQAIRLGILRPGDQLPTVKEVVDPLDDQPEHRPEGLPAARPRGADRGQARRGDVRLDQSCSAAARTISRGCGPRSSVGSGGRARPASTTRAIAALVAEAVRPSAVVEGRVNDRVAIRTSGLGKRYGSRWALRDCTLEIPSGSVTALVGPNGAGKTTLLHLVIGLVEPTSGVVEVFGRSPRRDAKHGAAAGRLRRAGPSAATGT